MPSDGHDKIQKTAFDGAAMTLRGIVGKILPSLDGGSDAVEIVIEGAEDCYREIRIHSLLQDANGNVVAVQPGSEVEITIRVRIEAKKSLPSDEEQAHRESA